MTCDETWSAFEVWLFPRWDCSVPVKRCTSTCWASITLVVLKHRNYAMWWTVAGNWIETWRISQLGLELDGPTSCKKQLWFLLLVKQGGQSIRLLPAQDALHPASCAKTFSGSVHIFQIWTDQIQSQIDFDSHTSFLPFLHLVCTIAMKLKAPCVFFRPAKLLSSRQAALARRRLFTNAQICDLAFGRLAQGWKSTMVCAVENVSKGRREVQTLGNSCMQYTVHAHSHVLDS